MIRKNIYTSLIYVVGSVLVLVGIVAGFVPFVPGIVLVVLGLYIISLRSLWIRRKLAEIRVRFPKIDRAVSASEQSFRNVWSKVKGLFGK